MGGFSYIELPEDIKNKKAIVNPQNADQQCFNWPIIAKHFTGENNRKSNIENIVASLQEYIFQHRFHN